MTQSINAFGMPGSGHFGCMPNIGPQILAQGARSPSPAPQGAAITASPATASPATEGGALYAVSLIDRRTGRPHRVNGQVLTALSRVPHLAADELLAGRDPLSWEVRIEALGPVSLPRQRLGAWAGRRA